MIGMRRVLAIAGALPIAGIGITTAHIAMAATAEATAPSAAKEIAVDVLKGRWVRPDGGYVIAIKGADAAGQLEAMYFNPNPLPFAKAQATRQGTRLHASFELQAGGYNGSTYELTYNPASDRLEGVYYQAVLKQRFDVNFVRR